LNTVKLVLAYSGEAFSGFQAQKNGQETVSDAVHKALERLYKQKIKAHGAGRTDSGVHAVGQVLSYTVGQHIPCEGLKKGLNSLLPESVRIIAVENKANGFHARHSAKSREYRYLFSDQTISLYLCKVVAPIQFSPDLTLWPKIQEGILGEHDFRNFRCTGSDEANTRRTIHHVSVKKVILQDVLGDNQVAAYEFRIVANAFLYRMVRNIMGALFEIFKGKQTPEKFLAMVTSTQKSYYYATAPAKGLCLMQVNY